MDVFAETFSETVYKTVISGCLWKWDGGPGMGKRLCFLSITFILREILPKSIYDYFDGKQVIQKLLITL